MDIQIEKYTKESLELIYNEAQKHMDEIIKSYRLAVNRSYVFILFLTGVIGFCLQNIFNEQLMLFYVFCSLIFLIPIFILRKNVIPTNIVFLGCNPSLLIHSYYENRKENQYQEYLKSRIQDLDEAIITNSNVLIKANDRVKKSYISFIVGLFVCLLLFWFLNSKCLIS